MRLDGFSKQASVTLPLQTPGTIRRAASAAQQGYEKTGRPRRIGEQSARGLRARAPARDGGAGRVGIALAPPLVQANAQQEQRDARGFRRARQTQGCGQIERARRIAHLDQGRAQAPATRPVDRRAQNRLGVASAHQRQDRGIGAEFRQPQAVQAPRLAFQKILPRPENGTPGRGAQSERQAEADSRRPVRATARLHLMQAGAVQAAVEKAVNVRRAEREAAGGVTIAPAPAFDPGERRTQDGQGLRAGRRSASPRIDPMHEPHQCS
jgi:hypothetical protein